MKKSSSPQRTKVFISYSHQDKKWLERLQRHLKALQRDQAVDIWDDTKIAAGAEWRTEIEVALKSAKVALLLVSADFLASEFITTNELPRLLAAADKGGAIIVPIIVSPCRFVHTVSLSRFQAINPPSKPLIKLSTAERESLFVKITEEIETALMSQRQAPVLPPQQTKQEQSPRVRESEKKTPDPKAVSLAQAVPLKKLRKESSSKKPKPPATDVGKTNSSLPVVYTLAHSSKVNYVTFSPKGEILAVGLGGEIFMAGEAISLWRVSDRKLLRQLKGHAWRVLGLAFSPDGATLASASADKTIRLWRVSDGKELRQLLGHTDQVASVAFSPDGNFLASGSYDHTVRLWNLSNGQHRIFKGHADWVNSVAYSPSGDVIASGSGMPYFGGADNSVRLWQVSDGKLLRKIDKQKNVIWSVSFSPDGTLLASASRDRSVMVWRLSDGRLLSSNRRPAEQVTCVAFSPDGALLASGAGSEYLSTDNTIRLFKTIGGKLIHQLEGHQRAVTSLAFSPDATMLASASLDRTVRLWMLK